MGEYDVEVVSSESREPKAAPGEGDHHVTDDERRRWHDVGGVGEPGEVGDRSFDAPLATCGNSTKGRGFLLFPTYIYVYGPFGNFRAQPAGREPGLARLRPIPS